MNDIRSLEISNILLQISQLDYSKILQHIPSVITFFVTSAVIKGYRLHRDFKPKKNIKVFLPPELTLKYSDVDEEKLLSSELKNYILKFVNTIVDKVPASNLINFYNNINGMKIKNSGFIFSKLFGKNTMGGYISLTNTIYVKGKYSTSIYHELFHLCSSIIANKIDYSGFSQHNVRRLKKIGNGINEGYTEILTRRYFSDMDGINSPFVYPIERYFVYNLETIVGQKKMENLYFNANLPGLIDELKQYESVDKIINFIRGVDFLNIHMDDGKITFWKNKLIIKKMREINIFLISCYTKKTIKEFNEGLIDEKEFEEKVKTYISDVGECMWLGTKMFKFFEEDDVINILNDVFKEMNVKGKASIGRK